MSSLASHSIRNAIFLFTVALAIVASARVAAAEVPVSKAAELVTLRGLLALQYPALFQTGASPRTVVTPPSVKAEPAPQREEEGEGV